ncbi:EAL domain-containing protein [Acidithiobacillus ferrianus]|uniref:EAL domain-containing protein n=2 Tax=Acidithiobacillus ferrianus TaxID=2678518 RepID=A0ACD5H851_9PROT|nr:EAL domain-containing protein [Acidithiobacillus ferrianus]
MKTPLKIPAFLTRPITIPPYRWTMSLAFWGTFVGVVVFSGWYAWSSWHRYEQGSQHRLMLASDMVATVTQKLLDGHASGLQFLGRRLQRAGALRHPRRARRLLLDYQKSFSEIVSANLITPNGQVVASTTAPAGVPLPDFRNNPTIWPGFQKGLQVHGMRIYHPIQGPLVDHWVIPLRYTVFSPGGEPLFVVTTPLRFHDIEGFLSHLPLLPGTAVGLIRNDFYLEGRWPVPQGHLAGMLSHPAPAGGALRLALQRDPHARHGIYAGLVTVERSYRFGAFTRLSRYPLTAFISIPEGLWLVDWWQRYIQFPLIFLVIALGFSLVAYQRILSLDRRWEAQRQTFERTLTAQATHDVLTGLPNREGLRLVFDQALARAERQERLLVVGFLDLDAFKPVNDVYGHGVGDDLLKEMARRLQEAVRRTDTVARLGGDEFVLLLEGLRGMDELDQVLARLWTTIARPFPIYGAVTSIQASLGYSIYPFDEGDADLLLRHADQAMYAAKARPGRDGEGWAQIYYPELGNINMGDELLRRNFLQALSTGAVTLRYQPLVALATGRVAGLEALTRWRRGDQDVSPDHFLPALGVRERQALGRFVLQTGLRQLTQWRKAGLDLFLSINVTPEELDQPGFTDTVLGTLADFPGVPPTALVLEVLEVGEILERNTALGHLQQLRGAGMKIALDDVGSAYASLLRLKNLPIDEIKIDQGFIRELPNRPQDLVFVESLVNLGLGMNVIITVEGVESEAHIALLREMEVHYLQGYAITKPLEGAAVADFVRNFVLGSGDADTPLLALYQHLGWVHAAEEAALNHGLCEDAELAACPITGWLRTHASNVPGVESLLAEHAAVHALGRKILQARSGGTREELHRLLGQLHVRSHQFQAALGEVVRIMRERTATEGQTPFPST